MRSRGFIRLIFLIVLLVQPVQWYFISRYGEPFPAVTMPSFGRAGPRDDEPTRLETIDLIVHFKSGPDARLSPRRLLAQCPLSVYPTILQENFKYASFVATPSKPAPNKPGFGLRAKILRWLPGLTAAEDNSANGSVVPRIVPWLSQRMKQIYPGRNATSVTIQWYGETFRRDWRSYVRTHTRELTHECTVSCNP